LQPDLVDGVAAGARCLGGGCPVDALDLHAEVADGIEEVPGAAADLEDVAAAELA